MLKIMRSLVAATCLMAIFNDAANPATIIIPSFGFATTSSMVESFVRSNPKNDLSIAVETRCLATALYHEARGEPEIGQIAVGKTILNRVRSSVYPDTVCGVVYQNSHLLNKCQFSFACDKRSDTPTNQEVFDKLTSMSKALVNGQTSDAGATSDYFLKHQDQLTHYHRYDVFPIWSGKIERIAQIGQHVFFRSDRVVKRYRLDNLVTGAVKQKPAINASNEIGL